MSTTASLNADQARRQVREERRDFIASMLFTPHWLAALVCTWALQHGPRQIDAIRPSLHGGRPFRLE